MPTPPVSLKTESGSKRQDLRSAGLKITAPRLRVLQALQAVEQDGGVKHCSAEQLYRKMLDDDTDISLGTIYRVLTQFEQAGLVQRHKFDEGHAVFELAENEHHDHMVCVKTGQVTEFCDKKIERLQREVASLHGYELVDHSLVLYVRPVRAKPSDDSDP